MHWTWAQIKVACGSSLTIAWSYVLLSAGFVLNNLDNIATALNDPTITQKVADLTHSDPKVLGVMSMMAGAITAVARARTLLKRP